MDDLLNFPNYLAVVPHAQEGIFIYFISRRYYTKEGDSLLDKHLEWGILRDCQLRHLP
jgi:hypothetical protein